MKLYLTLAMCAVPVLSLPFNPFGQSSVVPTAPTRTASCSSNVMPMVGGGLVIAAMLALCYAYYFKVWPFNEKEEKATMKDLLKLGNGDINQANYDKFKDLLNANNATQGLSEADKAKFVSLKEDFKEFATSAA